MGTTTHRQHRPIPAAIRRRSGAAPRSHGSFVTVAGIAAALVTLSAAVLGVAGVVLDQDYYQRHVSVSRCFTGPLDHVLAAILRGALLTACAILFASVPRLARRASRVPPRVALAAMARVGMAILAALLLAETVLRLNKFGESPPIGGPGPLVVNDGRYGWRFMPSQTAHVTQSGREIEYAIDARGNRAANESSAIDPSRPTLLVTGESIGFGFGLAWEDTFASRVGEALGLQVENLSVPRYGNDQGWLRLSDELARLEHPVVIVTVFIDKQLRRDVSRERPHLSFQGDTFALVPAAGFLDPRLAIFWTDEPFHGDTGVGIARRIFQETTIAARARGAMALFLVTNYGPRCDCSGEPWYVQELFDSDRSRHVDVWIPPEEWQAPDDFHPDPRGAKRIADQLIAAVQRADR